MKKKEKKSNAGRKPISDKKVQVSLYIRQSKIDKFGGIDGLKDALYEFVAMRSQNGAQRYASMSSATLEHETLNKNRTNN
jgi:hypothetical protein